MKIVKTANYKKIKIAQEQNETIRRKNLALELLDWHGGMSSPLYSVGSSWFANADVSTETIKAALFELKDIQEKKVNHPETITEENIFELQPLRDKLQFELEQQLAKEKNENYKNSKL